jgi:hypothetical protein
MVHCTYKPQPCTTCVLLAHKAPSAAKPPAVISVEERDEPTLSRRLQVTTCNFRMTAAKADVEERTWDAWERRSQVLRLLATELPWYHIYGLTD